MEDVKNSFLTVCRERIGNPVIGSFVLAWLICQWKVLIAVFWGEASATERIDQVQRLLNESSVCSLFVIPLIASISYPIILALISVAMLWLKTEEKNWRDWVEDQRDLSSERIYPAMRFIATELNNQITEFTRGCAGDGQFRNEIVLKRNEASKVFDRMHAQLTNINSLSGSLTFPDRKQTLNRFLALKGIKKEKS